MSEQPRDIIRYWYDPRSAGEDGLIGVGGDLTAATLRQAYQDGVFPWFNEDDPIMWWSPDPRGVFSVAEGIYISHRLARRLRTVSWKITCNQAFSDVMQACSVRQEGSWIHERMIRAYSRFHRTGFAHSIEVWDSTELIGGVYGVAVGALFAAESMFHRATDASKVALVYLMQHLRKQNFLVMDTQMTTPHTKSMGAFDIPRGCYLDILDRLAKEKDVHFQPEQFSGEWKN
ncbi:MAG: leucyl/phenylalanyl-tRNA--protein transferase [Zavarzinella sp.]